MLTSTLLNFPLRFRESRFSSPFRDANFIASRRSVYTSGSLIFRRKCVDMRTTLACHWCRKSKIKCRHHGKPPCQACASNPGRDCALSKLSAKPKRRGVSQSTSQAVHHGVGVSRGPSPSPHVLEVTEAIRLPETLPQDFQRRYHEHFDSDQANQLRLPSWVSGSTELQPDLENPLARIDRDLVWEATEIFQQQFTMFSFLHGPTLLDLIHGKDPLDIRFCGILALCARFIPKLSEQYGGSIAACQYFASYLRRSITCHMIANADIGIVQALLLLSFHDWGSGKGTQAWTYNGTVE